MLITIGFGVMFLLFCATHILGYCVAKAIQEVACEERGSRKILLQLLCAGLFIGLLAFDSFFIGWLLFNLLSLVIPFWVLYFSLILLKVLTTHIHFELK